MVPDFPVEDISESNVPPIFVPTPGFRWKFLTGVWAMAPVTSATKVIPTDGG